MEDAVSSRPPGATSSAPFWPSLDGFRGLLLIFVFAYHVYPPLVPGASITVDGFFVLSGFLITYLIVRERRRSGRVDLKRFYQRRALRLLPVAFVGVALGSALTVAAIPDRRADLWPAVKSVLFYYANFRAAEHPDRMSVFLPTWSLSTEEQFYVVWPLLLVGLLALRVPGKAILAFTLATLAAATAWLQLSYERGTPLSAIYFRPDLRIGGILVGCSLGLLYAFELLPTSGVLRRWLPVATCLGSVYMAVFLFRPQIVPSRFISTMAILAACVASGCILLQQVTAPLAAVDYVLDRVVLRWLGRASYTIYLVHVPVIRTVRSTWDPSIPVKFAASAVLTLAIGAAIHYGVERPFLRLKDRLEPASRRSPA